LDAEHAVYLRISGWYYSRDGIWPRFNIHKVNGDEVPLTLTRTNSPDIAKHFADARATWNRLAIETTCNLDCFLLVQRVGASDVRVPLHELFVGGPISDSEVGTFYVDEVQSLPGSDIRVRLSRWLRLSILAGYDF